jgi:diaminopimelate epimerase
MTAPLSFLKMNGLGNDFVVIDGRRAPVRLTHEAVRRIADRESGIGCDQLIVLENTGSGADLFMRIYNAEGGEVSACGNATRCVAHLAMEETGRRDATVETRAGLLIARRGEAPETISVDMGAPRLRWDEIPLAEEFRDTRAIELQVGPIDAPLLHSPGVVNMGNPHAVFFVGDVDAINLARIGPLLEHHPIFPERANISLAQVTAPDAIRLKVWERGAGLTQACGTAACAALVASARRRLSDRQATVTLPGGPLLIEWRESDDHVLMTGPFALDGEGVIAPELLGEVVA